ncbi:MAG: hypothetical protein K6G50_02970 [bacterium]|nr:hypothetical protein [bacterium]
MTCERVRFFDAYENPEAAAAEACRADDKAEPENDKLEPADDNTAAKEASVKSETEKTD